ncbi:hypothetical protein Srot_1788 [Segniliparus rotundus DSM 44985]|uniref:Uncharacterized protein n=1 Tax=Segniliparus rotundus (strain ATCC BAA-972 / CDC 1076 / CIP 108378 / DSM 44985 / JCM 13578) TaxID=640132 RepID=D6Z8G8_SEGRD|nr:hypothetical protein [Segniliparus rotundus]ADG98248.1 hypothetical protein Srot_1788 [Segniliparus rotundus DSM 44985]
MNKSWRILPVVILLAACGSDPAGPTTSSRTRTDPSALFAGGVPAYAKDLDGIAQSRLLMLRAIRRVDPCALAPKDELGAAQPPLVGAEPSDALASCALSFADDGPGERVTVSLVPDADRSAGEEYFQIHGLTVYQGRSGDSATCSFFFDSGLAKYPGAPRDIPDAKIQVRAERHDHPCGLANSVATAIAQTKPASLPVRAASAKILDADPCAVVADAHKAVVDFADTEAYRCGLVTLPEERSLWVEFHRLPENAVSKFPASTQGDAQVWADPAALPLAQLIAASQPSPTRPKASGAVSKRAPAPTSSSAKAKSSSGPRCTAYVKAPDAGASPAPSSPAASAAATARNAEQPVYIVVGGQIDCPEAKRLAGDAAQRLGIS